MLMAVMIAVYLAALKVGQMVAVSAAPTTVLMVQNSAVQKVVHLVGSKDKLSAAY